MGRRLPRLIVLCLATAASLSAQQRRQSDEDTIHAEVISVPVTVTDKNGRYIAGLKQQDFEVFDEGKPQSLTSFTVEESGVAAVLLLDVSGSMTSRLDEAKRAAIQFVRQLGPNDLVKIIQFDERVQVLSDFSNDKAQLEAAVNRAKVGGATAMHNAIYRALVDLKALKEHERKGESRHGAVIVLSDGDDTASSMKSDEILQSAGRIDVLVYAVNLARSNGRPVTDSPSAIFLADLARQNGGRMLTPEVSDLQREYKQLADELRHQYVLGYVPGETQSRSRYHTILVRVKNRKGVTLRYRLGYFATRASATQE